MRRFFKKYTFVWGLLLVVGLTIADRSGIVAGTGKWLKNHHGPDLVIVLIFFFSGLLLDTGQFRSGIRDGGATLAALALVFLVSPVIAAGFAWLPLEKGILIGVFLVAVMPTTLSSAIVMTGAAGGNSAHALVVMIVANILSVVTIPVSLSLLLGLVGEDVLVLIEKTGLMVDIGLRVVVPLLVGLVIRRSASGFVTPLSGGLQAANWWLVLAVVWMAFAEGRETILQSGSTLAVMAAVAFAYHALVLGAAGVFIVGLGLGRGRRESVLFVGGQKTLPLSIILQVALFPAYGSALAVCVVHHVVHLMMDGYLVGRLQPSAKGSRDPADPSPHLPG